MLRKFFALTLAAVLAAGSFVPAARAAEHDPLVLHTEMSSRPFTRYYLADGTPARTEWTGFDFSEYSEYTYFGNILTEEKRYFDNKLSACTDYDMHGTQVEHIEYDYTGKIKYHTVSEPTYDELGRLIGLEHMDYNNPSNRDLTGTGSIRYEYYGTPTVTLGYYEQDGNLSNGPEPIEWLVVGVEEDNLLLVSKYGLDSRAYHSTDKAVSWETSDLRTWLNGEFLDAIFSKSPSPYKHYYQSFFNFVTSPNRISDRLFLLSLEETQKYFPKEADRVCIPTPYAVQNKAYTKYGTGAGWWLLRTPGKNAQRVVSINTDGSIDRDGGTVSSTRGLVRPAMWVNNTILSDAENAPSRKHENITTIDSKTGESKPLASRLYTYDDAGHLICLQDYLTGDMETWEYDDKGNVTRYSLMSTDLTVERTYANRYTAEGLLAEQEVQEVQTKTGKAAVKDAYGIYYNYDNAGRLTRELTLHDDGRSRIETSTYDAQGNLLTFSVDGQVTHRYTYVPLSQAIHD